MQNTVYHGQSPLGFLSPENLPRCSMNLCLLLWTRRTGAAASSERFLLKEVVAVLLFCLFLPLRGKIKAWYVAVRIPEARGSKKKTLWFLTSFISAQQKGEMAQFCDQRELILKTALLWSCQAAEKSFSSQWSWFMSWGLGVEVLWSGFTLHTQSRGLML